MLWDWMEDETCAVLSRLCCELYRAGVLCSLGLHYMACSGGVPREGTNSLDRVLNSLLMKISLGVLRKVKGARLGTFLDEKCLSCHRRPDMSLQHSG